MSSITKFAWSGVAVVLAAALMLGIVAPQRASAAVTVTASSTVAISVAPATATTTGPGTAAAYPGTTIAITLGAFATDVTYNVGTTGNLVVSLPSGWSWVTAPTVSMGTITGMTAGAVTTSGGNLTIALSTAPTANGSITLAAGTGSIRANGNASASGSVTVGTGSTVQFAGVPAGTILGQVTATVPASGAAAKILLNPVSSSTACGTTNPVTPLAGVGAAPGIPADGSTGLSLCASVIDATGMPIAGVPVTFTVSVGYVSTGTGKTVIAFTNAAGNATTTYRGAGNVQTLDTVVASMSTINLVADPVSIYLGAPSGTTASKIVVLSPSILSAGAQVTNTSPGYSSPTVAIPVALQVTDSNGLGVKNQQVQISVDRGGIVENKGFTALAAATTPALVQTALQGLANCGTNPARSIIVTTGDGTGAVYGATSASNALSVGGQATPGAADFIFCSSQTDVPGKVTITASNITTTMPNATLTLAQAGRPAKINIKVDGSTVTATIVDAGGNIVADGTPVNFTLSQNVGAVSTACTTTTNGAANSVAALTGATGNVLVSTNWNEGGSLASASTCAAAGSQSLAVNVGLPSGDTSTTGSGGATAPKPTAPTTAGTGLLVGTSTVPASGFGLIIFGGGTTDQLVTASKCPKATSSFYATTPAGDFAAFIPGTTIAAPNAAFMAMFSGGVIPANTPLVGQCASK